MPSTARRAGARPAATKVPTVRDRKRGPGYIALLRRLTSVERDPDLTPGLTPDPSDDYLVALARVAGAHFLVSGDAHLTELKQARPPVLTPSVFLKRLLQDLHKSRKCPLRSKHFVAPNGVEPVIIHKMADEKRASDC
jgi:hypothetical protein